MKLNWLKVSIVLITLNISLSIESNDSLINLSENDEINSKRILREQLLNIDDHHEAFTKWHKYHNKEQHYSVESAEGLKRKEIFKDNFLKIKQRNSELTSFKLAPGPLSDLSRVEYVNDIVHKHSDGKKSIYSNKSKELLSKLFLQTENIWENKNKIRAKPINPKFEDWSKYYPSVRDQSMCGSCWAFSTMGSIEGRLSKITGQYEQLSTKYLVDCSTKDDGCEGGSYDSAFEFIIDNGVVLEKDYPYLPIKSECKSKSLQKKIELNRMLYCSNKDENNELHCNYGVGDKCKDFLQWSPVSTAIDAEAFDFQHYSSGIFESKCAKANHAVIITEITDEYVKIRNSWGSSWGEKGYMKVKRNKNNFYSCFTEEDCFAAINDK